LIRWIFSVGIIFLAIMSLLRLGLFLFFDRQGYSLANVRDALVLGFRYDLRAVAILSVCMLVPGSIPALNPFVSLRARKGWFIFLGIASFLLIFFYAIDFAHYSYLSQRLNASVMNYLVDAGISANMVWQTYPVIRILLLLVAGTLVMRWLLAISYRRIAEKKEPVVKRRNFITWFAISFLVYAACIMGRLGQYPLRWSDAFALGSDYKANLSMNPFQSFFSSMKFRHSQYDLAAVKEAHPILAPFFGFPDIVSPVPRFDRRVVGKLPEGKIPPNVVIVLCESFSAYKSSMWGNPLNTTPFFDSMARTGIFFDHCFSPSYGTARGVWALVTGIPDVEVSTTTSSRNPAAVDQHTIINDFKGYEKLYFLGGSTSWANIRGLLTNNIKGLHLFEQQDFDAPKIDVWGISDKNLFLEANKVLKKQTAPFIAVIQTADNHRPYTIPAEDLKEFERVEFPMDSLRKFGFESNDELNAFRYTDFGFRKFMEAAEKESYFSNTLFLFVGDHGIPGDAGRMFPAAWTGQRLTAEHIPLLIYAPRLLQARRISSVCSQIDVLPTLAGLSRISYVNTTLGRDLLDTLWLKGREMAFIYDPDQENIGLLRGHVFYRKQLRTSKEEIVGTDLTDTLAASSVTEEQKNELRSLTMGVYQVSRFMILQNKKENVERK
jgi:phosphoglycerol transferase MdoB-like AlkP superfamily enzyme